MQNQTNSQSCLHPHCDSFYESVNIILQTLQPTPGPYLQLPSLSNSKYLIKSVFPLPYITQGQVPDN